MQKTFYLLVAILFALNCNSQELKKQYPDYKNPGIATIGSLFIPGLGQFYNQDIGKGFCFLGGTFLGGVLFAVGNQEVYDNWGNFEDIKSQTMVNIGGILVLASYFGSLIDAPISATKKNKKNGFSYNILPIRNQDKIALGVNLCYKF